MKSKITYFSAKLIFFLASTLIAGNALSAACQKETPAYLTVQGAIDVDYTVNPEVHFEPKDHIFYAKIKTELQALERIYLVDATTETISFTKQPEAQQTAPTIYNLLKNHIATMAKPLGLDANSINIAIRPTAKDIKTAYNAHAHMVTKLTQKKTTISDSSGTVISTKISEKISREQTLSINAESLLLFAWHEGNAQQGVLAGAIAHELGHIAHQHAGSSIANELEADATGAKCLTEPSNLIKAVDMLTLAGNLFSGLVQTNLLRLDLDTVFTAIHAIVGSLIDQSPQLGHLGASPSHSQFSYGVSLAVSKALQRTLDKRLSGDTAKTMSLLYDELKDRCLTPQSAVNPEMQATCREVENFLAAQSMLTHPNPLSRHTHFAHLVSPTYEAQPQPE
jgi:hypothetical protein